MWYPMPQIRPLTSRNFIVVGSRQKTLGIDLPGNVLVFFKMAGCNNCKLFEPVFADLSNQESRVEHAILDVTQNKEVVIWSRETSTPIQAVPVLILYINGRPHAKFNGTKNIPSVQNFITKALQSQGTSAPTQQTQFMASPAAAAAAGRGGGMYGSAPSAAQANASHQQGKPWMPEIGTAPSMKGIVKGAGAPRGFVEDEEDQHLLIPDSVVPHNRPWEAEYGVGQ